MAVNKLLICVVGPTAIGKTAMAIELAKAFETEIVSADSRQFYREMQIGTAVPSEKELAEVPHHFIHNKSIHDSYSVGDFEKEAILKLNELYTPHDQVILVGGSGLYVDAVINGLDDFPEIPGKVRKALQEQLQNEGIESLQTELKKLDPISFESIDIHNPHRLIRALEICRGTGKPFSKFLRKSQVQRPFETIFIGLIADRTIVYSRIDQRVDEMIKDGLIDEAKKLEEFKALNALQTVGYKELFLHFDGEISEEEAISEIKKNTRRFAKRQGTWFRKNEAIHWFDYKTPATEIIRFIKQKKGL